MQDSPLLVHEFIGSLGKNAVVLDLGCGGGSIDYKLYSCRFKACDTSRHKGVDLFPPNVEFQISPADALPYENHLFDAVICNWIFEHLDDPVAVLRQIERVSKPEAYLYISIPNSRSFEDRLYRRLYPNEGGHVQRYDIANFLQMVYANSAFKLISFAEWAGEAD